MTVYRLEIENRSELPDALGEAVQRQISEWFGLAPRRLRTRKIYHLDLVITPAEANQVLDALRDPIAEIGTIGLLDEDCSLGTPWIVRVSLLPGVTDAVGKSVKTACEDCLGGPIAGQVYTSTEYAFWGVELDDVERVAQAVLYNPLIQDVEIVRPPRTLDLRVPRAGENVTEHCRRVPLRSLQDAALEQLSRERLLALDLDEMKAIRDYFLMLDRNPTDVELESIAQTWSEHCKHKIFNAPIDYVDPDGARHKISAGLFNTYIAGATDAVLDERKRRGLDKPDRPFTVSVFRDNAGVVQHTEQDHLVFKVETHNSPSALDPYGGAMTGIVGVNRDSFGCGLGADLLANVWGYCFGPPDYSGSLPPRLMHPRRLRDGVHRGVIDGGNQSGIPYMRGFELFDDCYLGKPLVYCGTIGVMPVEVNGYPTHIKRISRADRVVMVGGRVGRDGIHGATFSSVQLDERSPVQAVQIGDPITQKMMFDMLTEARDRGLYSGITDNGAGGLSSSVGEMATASGGAEIELACVPLKYPGLSPWEILVSEAQERMTVSVPPDRFDEFMALAARREVEATDLGRFTDSGSFVVTFRGETVADLSLKFLHEGVPRVVRRARWNPPERKIVGLSARAVALKGRDIGGLLLSLLRRPNLASNELIARHYDHEVKGLNVVKPFTGLRRDIPATATVMRVRHGRDEGIVLAEGIHPHYGDIDAFAMAAASVDEGVRRVLCAGADINRIAALDNFCWPDPIQSATTPDGEHKLAQLVRACEGLRKACEAYLVPLISGKDSMKNDAYLGGVKISILPTLLVSVLGQIANVRSTLTLSPRAPGDLLYLLGPTTDECGGSELARLLGLDLNPVPRTDFAHCAARYRAFTSIRDAGFVRSAHVVARGGLAVALSHLAMAGELGVRVSLDQFETSLDTVSTLFAESTGRILFTISPDKREVVTEQLAEHGLFFLGEIALPRGNGGWLYVERGGQLLVDFDTERMRSSFKGVA